VSNEDWKCKECGSRKLPNIEKMNENTDLDGNRGVMFTWVTCKECGEEYGIWLNYARLKGEILWIKRDIVNVVKRKFYMLGQ